MGNTNDTSAVEESTAVPGDENSSENGQVETPEVELQAEQQPSIEELQAELDKVKAQAAEYLDGWQRARAEFANFRRRTEAEREEGRSRSNEGLLLKLLPIVDDFERAFQTVPPELKGVAWVDGVAMILQKLRTLLESENVTPIECVGEPFDPQYHAAVMREDTTEYPDGAVIEEMQRGYLLGERVLRPSMVKVASNLEGE
jgi:molecular chaperone GrpE